MLAMVAITTMHAVARWANIEVEARAISVSIAPPVTVADVAAMPLPLSPPARALGMGLLNQLSWLRAKGGAW